MPHKLNGNSSKQQAGQIAVIVLLMVAALIVVALSLSSRTTQETATVTQTSESATVFSAAEAGAEYALSQVIAALDDPSNPTVPTSGTIDLGNNTAVNYEVQALSYLEMRVSETMNAEINLRDENDIPVYSGGLRIDWARETNCSDRASLIASIYYLEGGNVRVRHLPFGPSCNSGGGVDEFDNSFAGDSTKGYYHSYTISGLTTNDLFVRIKPVYNDTDLLVTPTSSNLPTQQYSVISRAENELGAGDETRAVEVRRSVPVAPSIMDYAVYSGVDLVK